MSCRDILVAIEDQAAVAPRLAAAAVLARRFGGRVNAVFPTGFPFTAAYDDIAGSATLIETYMAARREEAGRAEAAFRAERQRLDLSGEWYYREADAVQSVIGLGRLHDLVVLGQPNPEEPPDMLRPSDLVLAVGRPVLAIPYAGSFPTIGQRVLVAWNGARESARALHDAMFLLEAAEVVTVLAVDAEDTDAGSPDLGADDVAAALTRRGIAASGETTVSDGTPVADVLLSRAADLAADLIVMGAWGHSRLREYVLGGVSRGLFGEMTCPVLMSH